MLFLYKPPECDFSRKMSNISKRASCSVCQTSFVTLQLVLSTFMSRGFSMMYRFSYSPSIFPCLHWLTVAETGHCFSKQICSPMPTGISCLQEPPFTRYQLFENICVLPHQNNLLISKYFFFSSNIIFLNVIITVL